MNQTKQAYLYMIGCALLWSTGGLFIKLLDWHPMTIAGVRSLISAAVYYAFMKHEKINFVWNKFSVLGGIFLSLVFTLFIGANKLTTAANAIVLQYCAPVFILILSAIIFKERFRKGDVITVVATVIGISLFFYDKISGGSFVGNILALLAGFFFGAMFVTTGNADDQSRSSGIFLGHLFTAIVGVPFAFLTPTPINPVSIGLILTLGIFQLGIPYVLYGMAARQLSPLACSLVSAVEPLLNPIWVLLFYHEVPGFYALIGGAVIITAVVSWTVWSSRQNSK